MPMLLLLAIGALLSACSPSYDWREIAPDDVHYRVMMPAKPASMTREIDLNGVRVSMTMWGARVGEVSFTAAQATLPDDSTETRTHAVDAMRAAMVRNVAGRERSARAVLVPVRGMAGGPATMAPVAPAASTEAASPAAGAPGAPGAPQAVTATAPGWEVTADGRTPAGNVELHGIFASRGARAFQAVVIGPSPAPEAVRTFLDGFRILP